MPRGNRTLVVGVDLAGSPGRPTGVCSLRDMTAETSLVSHDEEILRVLRSVQPDLVTIDAPLTLPPGRKTIHDRSGEHFRECDRELQRRGIKFFPITLGPMRMLTQRGMALRKKIVDEGFQPVECYPGAAQDVWGLPRQRHDQTGLFKGLRQLGVEGLKKGLSGDELDAVTAALVGSWFLAGKGEILGGDAGIVMPVSTPPPPH